MRLTLQIGLVSSALLTLALIAPLPSWAQSPASRAVLHTPASSYGLSASICSSESARPARIIPPARVSDRWWGRDKLQHLTFSFLWTLGTQYVLVNKAGWSEPDALPASIGVTVTVGFSKELYDWRIGPTRHFSGKDLTANAVGILAAVGVIVL